MEIRRANKGERARAGLSPAYVATTSFPSAEELPTMNISLWSRYARPVS